MEEVTLKAMERNAKPKKARREGFIPGVLNGPGTASTPVEFDAIALNKVLFKHGTSAKLWIELGKDKKFGFIKEVQTHPVDGTPLHVSLQMISADQTVKMQLPISFRGHVELEHEMLQLQVYRSEAEVEGKAALMPDEVVVELSGKQAGDNVTAADLKLPEGIKLIDPQDEVYAGIKAVKAEPVEEETTEAAAPAETAAEGE